MAEGGGEEEAEKGQMVMLPHVEPVTMTLTRDFILSVPKVSCHTVLAGHKKGILCTALPHKDITHGV